MWSQKLSNNSDWELLLVWVGPESGCQTQVIPAATLSSRVSLTPQCIWCRPVSCLKHSQTNSGVSFIRTTRFDRSDICRSFIITIKFIQQFPDILHSSSDWHPKTLECSYCRYQLKYHFEISGGENCVLLLFFRKKVTNKRYNTMQSIKSKSRNEPTRNSNDDNLTIAHFIGNPNQKEYF